jgi:hypothetical protein
MKPEIPRIGSHYIGPVRGSIFNPSAGTVRSGSDPIISPTYIGFILQTFLSLVSKIGLVRSLQTVFAAG